MFENSRVESVARMMSLVGGPIHVAVAPNLALGGSACTSQLDSTVVVAHRPIAGFWTTQIDFLDEDGSPQSQPGTLPFKQGVPEDIVVIHAMFVLALMGSFQLHASDGHVSPTEIARIAKPQSQERDWTEFIHRWGSAVAQVYFMSQGGLQCLPGNSASFGMSARDVATESWPGLVEGDHELFHTLLTQD